jgi:hypothetical protein
VKAETLVQKCLGDGAHKAKYPYCHLLISILICISSFLDSCTNDGVIVAQHDVDRRLDEVCFVWRNRSDEVRIRHDLLPCLDIFDPHLCDAVVLWYRDTETLGFFLKLW